MSRLVALALLGLICVAAACSTSTSALAWGYQGHEVVGSIADQRLHANARQQVKQILNEPEAPPDPNAPVKLAAPRELKLQQAGPWADCVKSVVRHDDGSFHYEVDPLHLEYEVPCVPFSSAEDRARMADYAKRNWDDCSYRPRGVEIGCHNTYHFDDVAVQRGYFDRNEQGTNPHDLVAAIEAAIAVLRGKEAPAPFKIADKKEALLLLAHFVGDLHQPLHVGAVYLDAEGRPVDPDVAHLIDPATDTAGGNIIQDENLNLHREWDDIPTDIGEAATSELLKAAQAVPASQGPIEEWPKGWATDTLHAAHDAFQGLKFVPLSGSNSKWSVSFDDHTTYLRSMDAIKREQLAKGGARLAEILNAIWP
ncbi:MAG TPA: S1/P1 nuclease [Bradyrhizobium sp.]|nr:S1/P1 nuclease [Bradyrhizobium sp.]